MSWVSYSKLQTLCQALRNKFTTGELVIANDDKSIGAHLNHTAQDGLVTISPITEDGTTPAALWVTDSAANNATELTGGTLSYVTDVGKDTEDYTSLSLVGGVVNVSGKSGAQRRITNVADPVDDNDAVNKKTVDSLPLISIITSSSSATVSEQSFVEWSFPYLLQTGSPKLDIDLKAGAYVLILQEKITSISSEIGGISYVSVFGVGTGVAGCVTTLESHQSGQTRVLTIPLYLPIAVTQIEVMHQILTSAPSTSTITAEFTILKAYYLGD